MTRDREPDLGPPMQGPVGPVAPVLVEPDRVIRTASQLLFEVPPRIYDQLWFGATGDEAFLIW